jgi:uncharacterized protein YdaU (DUF1376 family)
MAANGNGKMAYMPFCPKDYRADDKVSLMNRAQRGSYVELLCVAWDQPEPGILPDDDEQLAKWALCTRAEWKREKNIIMSGFKFLNGTWRQKRIMIEAEKVRQEADKTHNICKVRRSAGAKGNLLRWQTDRKPVANAIAKGSQKDDFAIANLSQTDRKPIAKGSQKDDFAIANLSQKDDFAIANLSQKDDFAIAKPEMVSPLELSSSSPPPSAADKKRNYVRKPASHEEFWQYCEARQMGNSDINYLWNHWEGNRWTNDGKPIGDWKATVRSWEHGGFLPSQKMPKR